MIKKSDIHPCEFKVNKQVQITSEQLLPNESLVWDISPTHVTMWDIISYPLFADGDTGIYPHLASQYHVWTKAKRGIAMLSVDKWPYSRKQPEGNEFIPCSNDVCGTLKRSRTFKTQLSLLSDLNHRIKSVSLGCIAAAKKVDGGRDPHCDVISDVLFSLYLTLMTSNVKYVSGY